MVSSRYEILESPKWGRVLVALVSVARLLSVHPSFFQTAWKLFLRCLSVCGSFFVQGTDGDYPWLGPASSQTLSNACCGRRLENNSVGLFFAFFPPARCLSVTRPPAVRSHEYWSGMIKFFLRSVIRRHRDNVVSVKCIGMETRKC